MPGRPTHVAASAKKPRKGTGEDRNSSLVMPNAPNTSTNPDVTREFSTPENQGITDRDLKGSWVLLSAPKSTKGVLTLNLKLTKLIKPWYAQSKHKIHPSKA